MNTDLTGKVALITGGSRGIGRAIALGFARLGAKVVVASRKQAAVDAVAEEIRQLGGTALPIAAHVGDEAAIEALTRNALAAYGPIDVLVNLRGVFLLCDSPHGLKPSGFLGHARRNRPRYAPTGASHPKRSFSLVHGSVLHAGLPRTTGKLKLLKSRTGPALRLFSF